MATKSSSNYEYKDFVKRLRDIGKIGYGVGYDSRPLHEALGIKELDTDTMKALMIRLVTRFFDKERERDIILMTFRLLRGYTSDDRRERFVLDSGYMNEKELADYDKSANDAERNKVVIAAKNRLNKKEKTIAENLASAIINEDDLSIYIENLKKQVLYKPSFDTDGKAGEDEVLDAPEVADENPRKKRGKNPFTRYIDSEQQLTVTHYKFDYRAGTIPFCFRIDELNQIGQFCADSRLVLWWAIIGGGGSGKSRLAYEYMINHSPDSWKILFLRDEFFTQVGGSGKYQYFNDWSYPKDLMLIVDNVQRYSSAVAQWVESLIARTSAGKKIRVLLLERSGEDGLWYSDFSREPGMLECRYAPFPVLQAFSNDELSLFALQYAEASGHEINETAINKAVRLLHKIDSESRILYFILLLFKFTEDKTEQAIMSKLGLIDYILEREIRIIKERFQGKPKAFKNYMQLLIFASATKGIDVFSKQEWLSERINKIFDDFPDTSSALMAMSAQNEHIQPLTPDLIGEAFVLSETDEYFQSEDDIMWFIENAISYYGIELGYFIARFLVDFIDDWDCICSFDWIIMLLFSPKNKELKERIDKNLKGEKNTVGFHFLGTLMSLSYKKRLELLDSMQLLEYEEPDIRAVYIDCLQVFGLNGSKSEADEMVVRLTKMHSHHNCRETRKRCSRAISFINAFLEMKEKPPHDSVLAGKVFALDEIVRLDPS